MIRQVIGKTGCRGYPYNRLSVQGVCCVSRKQLCFVSYAVSGMSLGCMVIVNMRAVFVAWRYLSTLAAWRVHVFRSSCISQEGAMYELFHSY